jgi:hypothetical protein
VSLLLTISLSVVVVQEEAVGGESVVAEVVLVDSEQAHHILSPLETHIQSQLVQVEHQAQD